MSYAIQLAETEAELARKAKELREMKKTSPIKVGRGLQTAIALGSSGVAGSLAAVLEEFVPSVPSAVVNGVIATAALTAGALVDNPDAGAALNSVGLGHGIPVTFELARQGTRAAMGKLEQYLPPSMGMGSTAPNQGIPAPHIPIPAPKK